MFLNPCDMFVGFAFVILKKKWVYYYQAMECMQNNFFVRVQYYRMFVLKTDDTFIMIILHSNAFFQTFSDVLSISCLCDLILFVHESTVLVLMLTGVGWWNSSVLYSLCQSPYLCICFCTIDVSILLMQLKSSLISTVCSIHHLYN